MRASPLTDLLPQDPLATGKALARVSQAPGFASPGTSVRPGSENVCRMDQQMGDFIGARIT